MGDSTESTGGGGTEAEDPFATRILVRRAKDGEDDAFTALYARHSDRVRRSVALRLAGETVQDLEDVVQETFLYAFEGLKAGKYSDDYTDGGFRNWVATIAVNKVRDRARLRGAKKRGGGREKLMRDAFHSTFGEPAIASPLARPSQIVSAREFEKKLAEALARLEEKHRTILDLRDHCEMAYEEIATEMGYKKAATMRSLYKRAKERLRELLTELGVEVT
ncbi:MAG: RNA polymerase sigma factor [Planctomycetes bacterium]|nr:RNA polymerase sigma factor [Planctomycetota bacterium]MCB9871064.1 RNA polymerase sigma factor [Planctomycetota bacterium]